MSLILNIDTASEQAHVSLADNGQVLQVLNNGQQKEHAAFVQAAIEQLIQASGIRLKDMDAIAVTAGPGSYTGLRVGFASAKGLCYALKKPFITINTLEVLTVSAQQLFAPGDEEILYCPMMDARRMEVFTAVYTQNLATNMQPCAMILNDHSFEQELGTNKILFFGSGSDKWKNVCKHPHAQFKTITLQPTAMAVCTQTLAAQKIFTDLAYSEPLYLKEFQTVIKN